MKPETGTPHFMPLTQRKILRILLRNPGARAAEIAEQLSISSAAVSAHLKKLRESHFIEYAHSTKTKPGRHIVGRDHAKACLDSIPHPDAETLLGGFCTMRYERDLFSEFQARAREGNDPVGVGVFDVRSVIHAAVTTDPHLRIVSWSPRFAELVQETAPHLSDALEGKQLRYLAPPGQLSWLNAVKPIPFDWEAGQAKRGEDACFGSGGIWPTLLRSGIVDAYPFQIQTYDFQSIYLEFYIAPQHGFLGYQSIMMNVRNRVLAVKSETTTIAHYQFFHHDLRQPLQYLRDIQTSLRDAIEGPPELLRALIEELSDVDAYFNSVLNAFPAAPVSTELEVPVLRQLEEAANRLHYEVTRGKPASAPMNPVIRWESDPHDLSALNLLSRTIPTLQYGSFYGFLRNALTHGDSKAGCVISYRLDGRNLTITLADHGSGMTAEALRNWNAKAREVRSATVADIGGFSGLTLAIMGIKTSHGTVHFSPTDKQSGRGLTVTISLPVTKATLASVKEKSDGREHSDLASSGKRPTPN